MKATIAWWDLSYSLQTIESLRFYLKEEGVTPWETVNGMLLKFWISDPKANRWGAVMLWDNGAETSMPLPPNRATELIGFPATQRLEGDVEAIVGSLIPSSAQVRGRAFERTGSCP